MRIVYIVNSPGEGGMEKHVFLLAKYAMLGGHQVNFIFGSNGPLVEKVRSLGCDVHFVKMRAPYDPVAVLSLVKLFKSIRPDVVHTHFMRENFLAIDASKLVHIPAIFSTVHRLELKSKLQAFVNKTYSRGLTKFIAVSPIAKQYLLDEGVKESKIVSIPNGSEIYNVNRAKCRERFGMQDTGFVIGYVGRFTEEKGHELLVRAFSKLTKDNVKLALMGDGKLLEEIKALASRLRVQDKVLFSKVEFAGDRDNTVDFIACCDIYVQPSKIENLPTSVVEAMLLGVPTLASDCIAHKWLLDDGKRGYLFKNGNAVDASKRLNEILDHPELAREKAVLAKNYADTHLTAGKIWEYMEKLYLKYASKSKNMIR